jgi:uncharacterized glyoxalase superfamily protein PhnB
MTRPTFLPVVFYKDPIAALRWLERAFAFEVTSLITDAEGRLAHSELAYEGGELSVGGEWEGAIVGPARMRSPASVEGINTQFIRIQLADGIDAHCERARAADARILAEPEDQFYGSRVYRAMDPEGHVWTFDQAVREVSGEEMERVTGLKIRKSLAEV